MNAKCECEHVAHFDTKKRTPNGNPAHRYLQAFAAGFVSGVKTPYGTFNVCRNCADDCLATFRKNPTKRRQTGTVTIRKNRIRVRNRVLGTSLTAARFPGEDKRKIRRSARKHGFRVNPHPALMAAFKVAEAAHYNKNPQRRGKRRVSGGTTYLQEHRKGAWRTLATITGQNDATCKRIANKYARQHPNKKLRLFR